MKIQTINPANGNVLHHYPLLNQKQVDHHINNAYERFLSWRKTEATERQTLMLNMANCLRKKQDEFATLMAMEMGKPMTAGIAEINKCAWVCEYYAEHAESYLAPQLIKTDMKKSIVCYQPLGIIFAVMPWNFPFWQVFRFAAPNIMAGNIGLLKHASISAGTGNAIMALFLEAGFPEHVFQHVVLDSEMVAYVIAHQRIAGVTLTGSERAGGIVAGHAGNHLKKSVLELGGSDPYVVLADADLDLAAQHIVASRLNNTGQTCISAKRTIMVQEIAEQLTQRIVALASQYHIGDPMDPKTQLGPMARSDLRDSLHQQVVDSVAAGATLRMGGIIPNTPGYYYPITLLSDVQPGMPAFDDELFGPVFAMITATDEADAIRLANQTRFGLAAAVFTRDLKRGEYIATHEIAAGTCFVNSMVVSDPRLPFGGIKHSGYGRELSKDGFLEFMNIKTVGIHE
ncbi:MAG: NAD-dependent succinate-semialdehyde dehydrogenase [Legionellaceae bacterium]|nr:NAD-dependent succinate-semialdehyde dehydrogenase [Legionellaceae bacterium]